jgi:cell fate (sporulation/competence/biofilm development) regulator YlbF (YheA/YmcA/DUF963 family)
MKLIYPTTTKQMSQMSQILFITDAILNIPKPGPSKQMRRCGYCLCTHHTQRNCRQKQYDEEAGPYLIDNMIKEKTKFIMRKCLEHKQIENIVDEYIDDRLLIHFAKWMKIPVPRDDMGNISLHEIRSILTEYFYFKILNHPQKEKRQKIYNHQRSMILKAMSDNYEYEFRMQNRSAELNSMLNELERSHQEARSQLSDPELVQKLIREFENARKKILVEIRECIDSTEYQNTQTQELIGQLKQVPPLKEFAVSHKNTINLEPAEEGEEVEMPSLCADYTCSICLNDNLTMNQIVYHNCTGKHYTCYDCCVQMIQTQKQPSCPCCRQLLRHLSTWNRDLYKKLRESYVIE